MGLHVHFFEVRRKLYLCDILGLYYIIIIGTRIMNRYREYLHNLVIYNKMLQYMNRFYEVSIENDTAKKKPILRIY